MNNNIAIFVLMVSGLLSFGVQAETPNFYTDYISGGLNGLSDSDIQKIIIESYGIVGGDYIPIVLFASLPILLLIDAMFKRFKVSKMEVFILWALVSSATIFITLEINEQRRDSALLKVNAKDSSTFADITNESIKCFKELNGGELKSTYKFKYDLACERLDHIERKKLLSLEK